MDTCWIKEYSRKYIFYQKSLIENTKNNFQSKHTFYKNIPTHMNIKTITLESGEMCKFFCS